MKLVSLNIEKRNHLERVREFLARENPDVVAMMEVVEGDVDEILKRYPHRTFGPNFLLTDGRKVGVCMAAKNKIEEGGLYYADGREPGYMPSETAGVGVHRPVVVMGQIEDIELAVTHFTWTPMRTDTQKQMDDVRRLLSRFEGVESVLCGDFNIPRGNEAYRMLSEKYIDNIPPEVATTIDFDLHRANLEGKPRFEAVVDYVWSTSSYKVSDVRVESGVSDHYGIVFRVDTI